MKKTKTTTTPDKSNWTDLLPAEPCNKVAIDGMVAQIDDDIAGAEVGMFRMLRAGVGLQALKGMVEHGSWEMRMLELFPARSGRTLQRYMQQAAPFLDQHGVTAEVAWAEISKIDATQVCRMLASGSQPLQLGAGEAQADGDKAANKPRGKDKDKEDDRQTFAQMLFDFIQQRKGKDAGKPPEPVKPLTKKEKVEAAIAKANNVVNQASDFIADGLWALLPEDELESTMAGLRAAADKLRTELKARESRI